MSLDLSSALPDRVRVSTKGVRSDFNSHELVFIGDEEMSMDKFCELVRRVVGGEEAFAVEPFFQVERLNPKWAFYYEGGEFVISEEDLYEMFRYVITNTDIYTPLDPRPDLLVWLQGEMDVDFQPARDAFLKECKEGGVGMGFNRGRVRIDIPRL